MESSKIEDIINSIALKSDLESNDIPTLDLYMDQIMTLFEDKLANNKRHPDDKLLTKTMINNYSKEGLIKPIKGKKYTKEQILQMLLVYNLKNTITMQEIKQLLLPSYQEETSIEDLYQRFIAIKQNQKQELKPLVQNIIDTNHLSLDKESDRVLTIMALSALSSRLKETVEKIIDSYYSTDK